MAKENTTPSIERSVLLRMGFSTLEVRPLVEGAIERNLIGKGVGHIVYRVAKEKGFYKRSWRKINCWRLLGFSIGNL